MKTEIDSKNTPSESVDANDCTEFGVDNAPSLYLSIMLGFQHVLVACGSLVSIAILLSKYYCMDEDKLGVGELIGTTFVVSGISTLLQTTLGIRLPVVQGGTFAFVVPITAIMSQDKWACPYTTARLNGGENISFSALGLPEVGSDGHRALWQERITEVQGALLIVSTIQAVLGFSGILGYMLRFVGPLTITPAIALVGLSLFPAGTDLASKHWLTSMITVSLFMLCSQFMKNVTVPIVTWRKDKDYSVTRLPLFSMFPIMIAIAITWGICGVLTATSVLPKHPQEWGYYARTDIGIDVFHKANWFRFPYPGQWGVPKVNAASVLGMFAGVFTATIDSIGSYYACATFAGAPPPPSYAVNRGMFVQGIGCIVAGIWGSGNGTSIYGENVGAVAITKVGSVRVVQIAGILMIILGCFGKVGAVFSILPSPIIGGMLMVSFSIITAVGLSFLRHVDLASTRNVFILGSSLIFGLGVADWVGNTAGAFNTGYATIDEMLTVLLSTSMFVGATIGFILDNIIPGTNEERGILSWRDVKSADINTLPDSRRRIYDLPSVQKYINNIKLCKYLPVCPTFLMKTNTGNTPAKQDNIELDMTTCSSHTSSSTHL